MNESFSGVPENDETQESREAQLLPTHLSADFLNEYSALWTAAGSNDIEMVRSVLEVMDGHVQRYAERFANDPVILEALKKADPARLARIDSTVERLNNFLADPHTADLPDIAALCQELDDTLKGISESVPESGEAV